MSNGFFEILLIFCGFYLLLPTIVVYGNSISSNFMPIQPKIIGGYDEDISRAPYTVSMRHQGKHICCGVIVVDCSRWIITAAHCCFGRNPKDILIQHGVTNITSDKNLIPIYDCIINEKYNEVTLENDIALVRLQRPIVYGPNSMPVAISPFDPTPNTLACVSGWGVTAVDSRVPSETLQAVEIYIVDRRKCNETLSQVFGRSYGEGEVCAGDLGGGKDACQGDSGAPLVTKDEAKAVGIVSHGHGCAFRGFPGAYIRLYKHINMIKFWCAK